MSDTAATDWQTIINEARRAQSRPYGDEPAHHRLLPNADLPLGHTSVYRTVAITSTALSATAPQEFAGPLNLLDHGEGRARGLAEGVILTHEQAWRQRGVTLGRLLHCMTLAPGEVSQIAVSQWERTSRGTSAEAVADSERIAQSAGQQRQIDSVTRAVASETGSGATVTSSSGSQVEGGVGGVLGFLGGSASSALTTSTASSVGYSAGSRNLSSRSNDRVRLSTQQHSASGRSRRAALVEEASQNESESFNTRVVANYNRTHTLNMMYYEVLQVFELSTRVIDAERCLFVPMEVLTFTPSLVADFALPLARAAAAMGRTALAAAIETAMADLAKTRAAIARLQLEESAAETRLTRLTGEANAVAKDIETRAAEIRSAQQPPSGNPTDIGRFFENLGKQVGWASEIVQLGVKKAGLDAQVLSATTQRDRIRNERRDQEEAAAHAADEVVAQLNDRKLDFNQALWMQIDPTQVAAMLAGKIWQGSVILDTLDPAPVAVSGNLLGFRWGFPADRPDDADAFLHRHLSDDDGMIEGRDTIVLPTGGIFAEAVPGQANSAEELDLTRFWKWDEDTIPILPASIEALRQKRRAQRAEARPRTLGAPTLSVQAMPDAPPGPAHVLAGLLGASLFRDASGQGLIKELAETAQKASGAQAALVQRQAHDNISAYLSHLEALAPQVMEFLKSQRGGQGASAKGIDGSDLGALKNALGKSGKGFDLEALLGQATELGLFL